MAMRDSSTIRIATWNTKQGVAPRQKEPVLWEWIFKTIKADVIVLTEAKAPNMEYKVDSAEMAL